MTPTGISVIIPYYRGAKFITRSLASVSRALEQLDIPSEIVVVDDTPHDPELEDALKASPASPVIIRNPKNIGIAASRNAGRAAARYDILHFLDQDDEVQPTFYTKSLDALRHGSIAVLLNAEIISRTSSHPHFRPTYGFVLRHLLNDERIIKYHVSLKTIGQLVFHRDAWSLFIQTTFQGADDTLSFIRLFNQHKKRLAYIGEPLLRYHDHGGNYTYAADFEKSIKEGLQAYAAETGNQHLLDRLSRSNFQAANLPDRLIGALIRKLAQTSSLES